MLLVLDTIYYEITYAHDIIDEIKPLSNSVVMMEQGTMYLLLKLLIYRPLVRSNWKSSKLTNSRKYNFIVKGKKSEYTHLISERYVMNVKTINPHS